MSDLMKKDLARKNMVIQKLKRFILSDANANTFQNLDQYRDMLYKIIENGGGK